MSRQLKMLLAALGLVGFLLGSLVLLTYFRQSWTPAPPSVPPLVAPTPPSAPPRVASPGPPSHEELRRELHQVLLLGGIPAERIRVEREQGVTTYIVDHDFPPAPELDELAEPLRAMDSAVRLEMGAAAGTLLVIRGDRVVARLRFRPPVVLSPPPPKVQPPPKVPVLPRAVELPPPSPLSPRPPGSRGRLAIIVDDLGRDLASARELLAIDLSVTFAIIPQNEEAYRVATLAHEGGREVLIHMPMEPQGYPRANPGADALFVRQSGPEIRSLVQSYRQRVPYAVGGNNHMGSRFTEEPEQMAVVLDELRRAGMFFVDSRTSNRSVAYEVARTIGVPTIRRDIFLDNVRNEERIIDEIRKMVRMATRTGAAVAICHPYPETLAALRREAPYIRAQGVAVVPVSQLLVR